MRFTYLFFSLLLCLSSYAQPNPINRRAMAIAGLASSPTIPNGLPLFQFWFMADKGTLRFDLTTPATNDLAEIYVWKDQSGHNFNVTNSSTTDFATNRTGGPNGSNYVTAYDTVGLVSYTNNINVASAANWTMFFVVRRGGNANAGGFWFDRRDPDQTGGSTLRDYIRWNGGGSPSAITTLGESTTATTGASVFVNNSAWFYVTMTPSVVRTNGVQYMTATTQPFSLTNGFAILDMADHNTSPARYYVDMVEAIGYSTDMTATANLTNVEVYLKNKYGL